MFPVVKDHCPEDNKGLALLPLKSFRVFVFFRTATSVGGAKEDRTPDLLRAKQALSQLSYGPKLVISALCCVACMRAFGCVLLYTPSIALQPPCPTRKSLRFYVEAAAPLLHILVGLNGFEPSTSPLSGVRSNQLSYRPSA